MSAFERLTASLLAVISHGGYAGVLGLMAVESACVPLPSEIIMPFAGYLVSTGRFDLWSVSVAGALGCNLGSVVGYELGRRGGRPFLRRYGRYLLLSDADLGRAERFFGRFGALSVIMARLLPGIRSFIAFPAGMAGMPLLRFHVFTFLGSWPWCFGLAYAGERLGARWRSDPRLASIFHRFDLAIAVLIAAVGALIVYRRLSRRG